MSLKLISRTLVIALGTAVMFLAGCAVDAGFSAG